MGPQPKWWQREASDLVAFVVLAASIVAAAIWTAKFCGHI